jgi:hypothetical protein
MPDTTRRGWNASAAPGAPTASSATPRAGERLIVVIAPPLHALALVKLHGCEEEKLAHAHRVLLRDVAQDGDLVERAARLHHHRPSFTNEQLRAAAIGFDAARKLGDDGFGMVFLVLAASLRSTSVLNSEREEKGERRRVGGERWSDLTLQAQREGIRPNLARLLQW